MLAFLKALDEPLEAEQMRPGTRYAPTLSRLSRHSQSDRRQEGSAASGLARPAEETATRRKQPSERTEKAERRASARDRLGEETVAHEPSVTRSSGSRSQQSAADASAEEARPPKTSTRNAANAVKRKYGISSPARNSFL